MRAATALVTAEVKPDLSPNQAEYDPTDEKLRDAASLLQQGLNATDVKVATQFSPHRNLKQQPFKLKEFADRASEKHGTVHQLLFCPILLVRPVGLQTEEELFTKLIDQYKSLDAKWVPDVVGRALGNRGNARSRQGKLDDALEDYNSAIELCPWSVDPVLNRQVT